MEPKTSLPADIESASTNGNAASATVFSTALGTRVATTMPIAAVATPLTSSSDNFAWRPLPFAQPLVADSVMPPPPILSSLVGSSLSVPTCVSHLMQAGPAPSHQTISTPIVVAVSAATTVTAKAAMAKAATATAASATATATMATAATASASVPSVSERQLQLNAACMQIQPFTSVKAGCCAAQPSQEGVATPALADDAQEGVATPALADDALVPAHGASAAGSPPPMGITYANVAAGPWSAAALAGAASSGRPIAKSALVRSGALVLERACVVVDGASSSTADAPSVAIEMPPPIQRPAQPVAPPADGSTTTSEELMRAVMGQLANISDPGSCTDALKASSAALRQLGMREREKERMQSNASLHLVPAVRTVPGSVAMAMAVPSGLDALASGTTNAPSPEPMGTPDGALKAPPLYMSLGQYPSNYEDYESDGATDGATFAPDTPWVRCEHPGCTKGSISKVRRCQAHCPGSRCQHPDGCRKTAQGGGTRLCISHGGGHRCEHPAGCYQAARGATKLCSAHGGGPRCTHPDGCDKRGRGPMKRCAGHTDRENEPRCEHPGGCLKPARGTLSNKRCIQHGGSKRCEYPDGCEHVAVNATKRCKLHGGLLSMDVPGVPPDVMSVPHDGTSVEAMAAAAAASNVAAPVSFPSSLRSPIFPPFLSMPPGTMPISIGGSHSTNDLPSMPISNGRAAPEPTGQWVAVPKQLDRAPRGDDLTLEHRTLGSSSRANEPPRPLTPASNEDGSSSISHETPRPSTPSMFDPMPPFAPLVDGGAKVTDEQGKATNSLKWAKARGTVLARAHKAGRPPVIAHEIEGGQAITYSGAKVEGAQQHTYLGSTSGDVLGDVAGGSFQCRHCGKACSKPGPLEMHARSCLEIQERKRAKEAQKLQRMEAAMAQREERRAAKKQKLTVPAEAVSQSAVAAGSTSKVVIETAPAPTVEASPPSPASATVGPTQPPPPSWLFPFEKMPIEVQVEDEEAGGTRWVAATVQSVHLDSTFSAEIHEADGTWVDWFTWEDEDVDWRREDGRGFRAGDNGAPSKDKGVPPKGKGAPSQDKGLSSKEKVTPPKDKSELPKGTEEEEAPPKETDAKASKAALPKEKSVRRESVDATPFRPTAHGRLWSASVSNYAEWMKAWTAPTQTEKSKASKASKTQKGPRPSSATDKQGGDKHGGGDKQGGEKQGGRMPFAPQLEEGADDDDEDMVLDGVAVEEEVEVEVEVELEEVNDCLACSGRHRPHTCNRRQGRKKESRVRMEAAERAAAAMKRQVEAAERRAAEEDDDDDECVNNCYGSCLAFGDSEVVTVRFDGSARSRPDPDEFEGGWGYTVCCGKRAHFDCLGRWLNALGHDKVDTASGTQVALGACENGLYKIQCPLCKSKMSRSSMRQMKEAPPTHEERDTWDFIKPLA